MSFKASQVVCQENYSSFITYLFMNNKSPMHDSMVKQYIYLIKLVFYIIWTSILGVGSISPDYRRTKKRGLQIKGIRV